MINWKDIIVEVNGHSMFNEDAKNLGKYRKLTDKEVEALAVIKDLKDRAKALEEEAARLRKQAKEVHLCSKHGHLVYDTAGLPFDNRMCLACGSSWTI